MDDAMRMDYCACLGKIVKGVKKMKKRRTNRNACNAAEELVQNDSVHTLISKLDIVEKKLEKLDKSLPNAGEASGSVGLAGTKLKVELPGNWADILREHEASGSHPCLEVSFKSDLTERTSTQDHTGPGCSREPHGSMQGRNPKSCSCEKAMQREKMDVAFVNDGTSATVLLSRGVRKEPSPLVTFSEDVTRTIDRFDQAASNRSCSHLVGEIPRVASGSELNYVSPGPLRDGSDPSTYSGSSIPNDCRSCGFPWKVLFDSTDSSPTYHCGVHCNFPSTECGHNQNSVFGGAVSNPECVSPPVESQHEFIDEATCNSHKHVTDEERTEYEGHGELQGPSYQGRACTGIPEWDHDRGESPRFSLPRLDLCSTGTRGPGSYIPEKNLSNSSSFQTVSNTHHRRPISSLFIDEGIVLTSHPSGPLPSPHIEDAPLEHGQAIPSPPIVRKFVIERLISFNPRTQEVNHAETRFTGTSSVNPSNFETPAPLEPSPNKERSTLKKIQSAGHIKPFDSGKIETFGNKNSCMPNDGDELDENDSDFESALIEEFINGAMMSSLLSHLADNSGSDDGDVRDATSELLRKTTGDHEETPTKNLSEIVTNSKYLSSSSSEELQRTKFKLPVKNQLVMALRVENDRTKNLCVGKLARALMDSKVERTRRWIEGINGSCKKRTKTPSMKLIRNVTQGDSDTVREINGILATSDIMRNRHTKTMVVRPEYTRHHRKTTGSTKARRSTSTLRKRSGLKDKHQKSRTDSKDIESEKTCNQKTGNHSSNVKSDEVIGRPLKRLLPGMCIMAALGKAKNRFKNEKVVSISVDAKEKFGCPKVENDNRNNVNYTKNNTQSTHHRSHRVKRSSGKHPITMTVSQVRIVNHDHRRDVRNREHAKNNEGYSSEKNRFGERCRHPECEKLRSPASLWDMLERSKARLSERANDQRGSDRQARNSYQKRQQSSSEESVIYQRLKGVRDGRVREHYIPRRVENVHYGRGYLLDTITRHSNDIQDEDYTHHFKHHDHDGKNHQPHHAKNDHHHHSHGHRKSKQGVRVKRRAFLRESTSSSDSSSEALVISKPDTRFQIPKPKAKVEFIETEPKKKRVKLPPYHSRPTAERAEPSRFRRAYERESHAMKHHAPLVRDILRLNQEDHHPPEKDLIRRHGGHTHMKANKRSESSESGGSFKSEDYSHSQHVKSAPEKSRQPEMYQAHTRAKSLGYSQSNKTPRSVPRLSQRRLTSSDSKSSAGFDQINVKDFVDFLVTLNRNTVGTLTNKRKAMRLYRSYLNGEYDSGLVDKGDLVSRIKKAHHRQK